MLYNTIKKLSPYLFSVRIRNEFIVIDLRISKKWLYEPIIKLNPKIKTQVSDKTAEDVLISFFSLYDETSTEELYLCVEEIIKFNEEREKKKQELEDKIRELEESYKKEDLEYLNKINLNGRNEFKGEEVTELAGEGDREGSSGDRDPQTEDDI